MRKGVKTHETRIVSLFLPEPVLIVIDRVKLSIQASRIFLMKSIVKTILVQNNCLR